MAQQAVTSTYAYNGLPLLIPGASTGVTSVATLTVPTAIKIARVTAQVQIQYPNSADLKIYLFSPEGTRTILLEHDCNVQNVDTTFDDAAPSSWKDFCPVEAGRGPFRPDQPLSNFNSNGSAFGIWRLALQNDQSDSRSGWLTQFSITITGTTQIGPTTSAQTIVNAAGLNGGGTVAPGEMVSIFGIGLGPAGGTAAGLGALPATLGGTSVMVNGTAVPLAYSSAFRVDAQMPFNLSPGSTATVQVNYNNQTSSPASVTTVSTVPGLYTSSPGSAGPATAANQDGSTNSKVRPAAKGSVIAIYASGVGALSPALTAGAVPPINTLSIATGNIGAFIGGVPAPVMFAGAAPGYPGLYQINIQVPASAPSGTQEVLLYANSVSSQKNATVEIQ